MRIIVEGIDGVGKSTLVNKLSEKYNLSKVHLTNKDRRDYLFYDALLDLNNVVFDRHYISEPIYSTFFKRENAFTPYEHSLLHKKVKDNKIIVLILVDDPESVRSRMKPDENDIIKENYKLIISRYRLAAIDYNFILVDYSKGDDPIEAVSKACRENCI